MDIIVKLRPQSCQDTLHSTFSETGGRGDTEHQAKVSEMAKTSFNLPGEQIEYASKIMALQPRSHVFSISIVGDYAQLIRWDRTGACVSARFNYHDGINNWLAEFLFRYWRAAREQCGFDCYVKKANEDEVSLLDAAVKEHLRRLNYPDNLETELARTVDESYPAYMVRVSNEDYTTREEGGADYVICRPFTESSSLCGRATRGYLAWGISQQKLVFLKDAWRTDNDIFLSEANVYDSLRRLGSHQLSARLPVVIACGDVRLSDGTPLCTLTQSLADPYDQWSRHTLQRRIRHRIVQKLALPLCMVRNSRGLSRAVRNTLEGNYTQLFLII